MTRDRDLESTRQGRCWQAGAIIWALLGIGLGTWYVLAGFAYMLWAPAIMLAGATYIVFGPGQSMVRTAREHKAFMDNHRKVMASYDWR
jgi:hypothetical protein